MALSLNGLPTIIFIQRAHLNGPQFKWAPNNNIDPGGPGSFNLIFANQFKWTPYNNIQMIPNLNGLPT